MDSLVTCPACGGRQFRVAVTKRDILREIREREEFVRERIPWKPKHNEVKDLLDFMHGCPAAVVACSACGVLQRAEKINSYDEDPNDPDLMLTVLPRYVEAFAQKREAYEPLLPARAEVLEIGPHLGAFLRVAEEWNWRPVGLDVGRDTSEFVRSLGLSVMQGAIEEAHLGQKKYDAIFIWNCFEQLLDPVLPLRAAHRLLKRHGVLVVRVPNAEFYESNRNPQELAYNNLLGWPYLYGYNPEALEMLLGRQGFRLVKAFHSELITMPFPEITRRIAREQPRVSRIAEQQGAGPWIELVFRKIEAPVRTGGKVQFDSEFLPRAA